MSLVKTTLLGKAREAARRIKRDAIVVWFGARDARTPLFVKLLAFAVAAYAFSPIDLIPDFIPVLGYLDDLVIVPLGILLVMRLLPAPVLQAARERAAALRAKPRSLLAAALFVLLWIACAAALGWWGYAWWQARGAVRT